MDAKLIKAAAAALVLIFATVGCSPQGPTGTTGPPTNGSQTGDATGPTQTSGGSPAAPPPLQSDEKAAYFGNINPYVLFTPQGIFYTGNGPIRFTAIDTGATTVICDKPDCRHEPWSLENQDPSCFAQVNCVTAFAMHEGRQIFARELDGSAITVGIYTADANGANRRLLARIEASRVRHAYLVGDIYVLVFSQNYVIDEFGLLEELDELRCGLAVVDLRSNTVELTEVRHGYEADCDVLSIQDGVITYVVFDIDEPIPSGKYEEIGAEAYYDLRYAHSGYTVYQYDTQSKEETIILQERGKGRLYGMDGGFLIGFGKYGDGGFQLVSPSDGERREIPGTLEGRYQQTDGGWLYYCEFDQDEQMFYHFRCNLMDGTIEALNKDGVGSQVQMDHIFADVVYLFGEVDGGSGEMEYAYCVMSRGDFLAGNFENMKPLLFMNRQWGDG